jgi:acetolactate synthase-1/2/3 large subunit
MEAIPGAIRTAFRQAYDGRPGPTAVEIPVDVQAQQGWTDVYPSTRPTRRLAPPDAVREAAHMLTLAASPLVFVGRGAVLSGCGEELVRLIERLGAPCFVTPLARGILPVNHPLNTSWGGARYGGIRTFLEEADVVLVVGSSLDEAAAGWSGFKADKLIQIDICTEMIGRTYPVAVGLVGDATGVLGQLLSMIGDTDGDGRAGLVEAEVAKHRERAMREARAKPYWPYIEAIQRALPRDAIVTNDGSQANYRGTIPYLQRDMPNAFHVTRMAAALGFALPAALGCKIACPERPVVAIAGDGGFMFTSFSLSTAVQQHLSVTTVVFNNDAYGIIRRLQTERHGRAVGAELHNPDFVSMARAYGARGVRAEAPEALYEALVAAWDCEGPTVIDVPLEAGCDFARSSG